MDEIIETIDDYLCEMYSIMNDLDIKIEEMKRIDEHKILEDFIKYLKKENQYTTNIENLINDFIRFYQ